MGKKKFIDKKKSATFQLIARDSSDPLYDDSPGNDRVFVRVDNNLSYSTENFNGENEVEDDHDSIFADAPEDCDVGESANSLPEKVRKEILELGFPDDGYNYLSHMREIKNLGGGSAFYNNPKTRLDQIPSDVKAYDASRLQISTPSDDRDDKYMYNVASETVGVRVQRALDPEVAALLNDDDLSRFGSDVEDFEEDFVIQANLLEDGEDVSAVKGSNSHEKIDSKPLVFENDDRFEDPQIVADSSSQVEFKYPVTEAKTEKAVEESRVRRLLDEQFDILESQEYGSDDDEGDDHGYEAEEEISLAEKLKRKVDLKYDDTDVVDLAGNYRAPADLLRPDENPKRAEHADSAREVIRRCVEYGEKYENVDPKDEVVLFEESSGESEVWDCESVISTYSNLDNHPGQIQAPDGRAQKKKLLEAVFGAVNSTNQKIVLKGREKMPVDFLPNGRKTTAEKTKAEEGLKTETQKRKQHGLESKEEKKERKAAVKEERRVARQMKKEMKGLFKGEALHAQKVAASSRPSIHLM